MALDRRRWLAQAGAGLGGLAGLGLLAGCEPTAPPLVGGYTGQDPLRGHVLRDASPGNWANWAKQLATRTLKTRFVVAGAGVAGLAAARALCQRGIEDFVVLDMEPEAGGNARGDRVQGLPCPMGAHYLPVPGANDTVVQDLLEELGVRQRRAGRWQYDERALCHSPQERLWLNGQWQEGLLPLHDVGPATLDQYQTFAKIIANAQTLGPWTLPATAQQFGPAQRQWLSQSMAQYLSTQGLNDPHLLWYLDYCCRDEYGAGLAHVSAWAGLHYFASRHGFKSPQTSEDPSDSSDVLTWPQGNAWLTEQLAQPLQSRLHTQQMVVGITEQRHQVEVLTRSGLNGELTRWLAEKAIVALPIFVAARVVNPAPTLLAQAAKRVRYAPWWVANLHLASPLFGSNGAPLSWDNVLYGDTGLGYVNASHQSLNPVPGPTVLTYYKALGPDATARGQLLAASWQTLAQEAIQTLSAAHPDLPYKVNEVHVTRYGHAMAIPTPGGFGAWDWAGQDAHHKAKNKAYVGPPTHPAAGRLLFAHSDWAGYSVFEEAFHMGHGAGLAA